ncbi:Ral guanine nucleotide dissociation stimulator-like 1 [Thelohanellus kitauei]|uniref:Ral guanine nucleotide dissociation stimulator-like 1 n=1 Tax=Thelohanellus kitauei TaxID=669202 RepID=A0A0C2J9A1_THEKT|nr:Ral guanine nucleotide dissociation stimulator-like 1 [Thelohanellus kitauei]
MIERPSPIREYPGICYRTKKNENGDSIDILAYGTLEKIMDYICFELADHGAKDITAISVLFATYPAFTDSSTLLNLLKERYTQFSDQEDPRSDRICTHILNIFLYWIKNDIRFSFISSLNDLRSTEMAVLEEFFRESDWKKLGMKFFKSHMSKSDDESCSQEKVKKSSSFTKLFIETKRQRSLTDFLPREIAETFTKYDAVLLKQLNVSDCLGALWGKRSKKKKKFLSTVTPTVDQFNMVSNIVVTSITRRIRDKVERKSSTHVIEHWIGVCEELKRLRNFTSLQAICSSLNSFEVYNLKKEWSLVSKQLLEKFEEHQKFLSSDENYRAMREYLKTEGSSVTTEFTPKKTFLRMRPQKSTVPCGTIPYLGMFLADLIAIDEMFPTYNANGLLNFDKKRKEFVLLGQLMFYQSTLKFYQLQYNTSFLEWAQNLLTTIEPLSTRQTQFFDTLAPPKYQNQEVPISLSPKRTVRYETRSLCDVRVTSKDENDDTALFGDESNKPNTCMVSLFMDGRFLAPIQLLINNHTIADQLVANALKTFNHIFEKGSTFELFQFVHDEYFLILPKSVVKFSIKKTRWIHLFIVDSTISKTIKKNERDYVILLKNLFAPRK